MPKKTPVRSNRKKEIVEATIAVIAAHGYHGTTVSRVAGAAVVSIGLMNFHFKTKDKLFDAVFKHLADEFLLVWHERTRAAPAEPWARLEAMIEAYFDRSIFTPAKLAVWFSFWSDPELRDKFRDAATAVERYYVQELEGQIYNLVMARSGSRPNARAISVRVAAALSAMIDGFWLQALLYPKAYKTKDAIKSCLAFLKLHDLYYEQSEKLAEATAPKAGRAKKTRIKADDGADMPSEA